MRVIVRAVMLGVGLLVSAALAAQVQLPVAELSVGMHRIEAEVAHTDQTRRIGLMNRQSMPEQRGMVFVFTHDARHCMWMRNTLIPLSVAFLDNEGRILNIEDMEPLTEDSHCAAGPARFALEMNKGWFERRGIGDGIRIRGIESLPQGR
ncbi:MAG TPA: DUF192 domain-containing protein [Azoarcus taiwanensis]|nr:DUF192 domain-containing protein [Azoarcus taiwanensis]